jgi:hypothetical protein
MSLPRMSMEIVGSVLALAVLACGNAPQQLRGHKSERAEPANDQAGRSGTEKRLPSDNCLRPEEGIYTVHLSSDDVTERRSSVLLGLESRTVLQVVVSGTSPLRLVLTETPDRRYYLALFPSGHPSNNSAAPASASDSGKVLVDAEFAKTMRTLWVASLRKTRYPDTAGLASATLDGVEYHFWASSTDDGGVLSGYAHSPDSGSYLADLTTVVDSLVAVARGEKQDLGEVRRAMQRAINRSRKNEPCERVVP